MSTEALIAVWRADLRAIEELSGTTTAAMILKTGPRQACVSARAILARTRPGTEVVRG